MEKKKNFLATRRGAALLAAGIMLLSVLIGVNRSLGVAVRKLRDGFDEGVYVSSDDYRHKSIRSQLKVRCEAALSLMTLAEDKGCDDELNELRAARNIMMSLLEKKSAPPAMFDADRELGRSFAKLFDALNGKLGTTDIQRSKDDLARMNGAASVIEDSYYNESVREFRRNVLSDFPTNILKYICFVDYPELFE